MANATIQFTQAANVGADGQSVLGFVKNQPVTMTDAGGAGATSYLWSIVSWPSPLSSPPAITNATAQVATIATPVGGFSDGVYIVKLLRTEGSTVTADVRFFGVGDEDGLILPSPGQSANMHNTGTTPLLAIKAGWAGRADATSNDQLDAYLRFLKSRVGRWIGSPQAINFTSSSASTVPYTDGTDKPFRIVTLTGSGVYTEELDAALTAGKVVRYLATISAGAGGLTLKSGIGGSTILALTAPSTGTAAYEVEAAYTGSAWVISQLTPLRGPANQVVKTDGSKVAFGLLDNSSIAANAAIDGTKINPDFGSQTVIAANVTVSGLTANAFVKTDGSSQLTTQTGINLSDLTTGSQAQGDLAYFNGTSWVRLPAGTSGHVLHTQGGGANPQWAAVTPNFGSQDVLTTGVFYGSKFAFGGSGPTITNGTGAPSGSEPNGSVYLRTNGTNAETGVYTRQAGAWYALGGGSTGPAGGDLSGTYPNPTVASINGATVPVAGSLTTGHLLQVAGAAALTYALLANANVASNAAIDGTKISPNFGSQAIVTTGNITGAVTTLQRVLYANGYTPQWAAVTSVSVQVSDVTLNAAQYGTPIIEATGSLSVDRNLIFPLTNGSAATTNGSIWFVRNATTGGYNVNVKGPTGLAVQVPYGGSAVVYTDGTNFYSVGASGSGGGSSGAAGGDLLGSYPNPQVAFLTGTGGIVKAIAPYFAIDGAITSTYSFVPDVATSTAGAGFVFAFTGQHGKVGSATGTGGGVLITGGNSGAAAAFGGGLEVQLGNNTYDTAKGGYVKIAQHSGVSGVLQAWVDGAATPIAHVVHTGVNIASGMKLYMGGTGINPAVLTSIPTLTSGAASPSASEPTGSIYMKSGATSTTDVFWVRHGSTWASLGEPTGAAGGDLSGTYPNPTVAKINGTSVPAGGSLTTGHVPMVSGAAALTYGFIANANVAAAAAIAGTKISPDFGSQIIQTTNNIQGAKFIVGSSGPTVTKGTGVPSTSENNGSLFMRTDGADGSEGLYTRQGGAWYQVGAGAGGPPTGPASGDLSGTYPGPTVAKINGATVPTAGSLTTSHVLMVSGASALTYGFIANANVAAGAAIAGSKITPDFGSQTLTAGKLTVAASGPTITKGTGVPSTSAEPAGSLFMRTDGTDGTTALYSYQASAWVAIGTGGGSTPTGPASGDLSGSYPNPTVAKLNGITAPGSAPSAGNFLKASSSSALTYANITSSDLPSATTGTTGIVQLTNDFGGTATAPTVLGLTGSAGSVTMRPNALTWLSTLSPSLTQATPTSDLAVHDFTITSQAPYALASTHKSPGNIILAVPASVGGGTTGKISFTVSGSEQAYVGVDEMTLGASTRLYLGGNTLPAVFSGVGVPAVSAPDGSFYLVRGSTASATTAYVRASGAWTALGAAGATSAAAVTYTDGAPTFGSTDVQGALDAIKALHAPGGVRISTQTYVAAYGVAGAQSTNTTTFVGVGLIRYNPTHYYPAVDGGAAKRVKLKAYLETTAGLTGEVRLYDLQLGAVVSSSTLSTASATPTLLTSVDISGNLAAGVEHDYEVQIRLTGSPTSGDRVTCKMAQLEVTYV